MAGLAAVAVAGCQVPTRAQGASGTVAEYSFGSVKADLPGRCRVPAVLSAADSVLRRRGYSVSAEAVTESEGQVRAQAVGADSVTVSAVVVPGGTRVGVRVGLVGDETLSRSILDDVLRLVVGM